MSYKGRSWSSELVAAASAGLPGGADTFQAKLPPLAAPDAVVGSIAAYFVERYGFDPMCRVAAGSGDNPQTKVLVEGDLLSLGTSFVNMVATDGRTFDLEGFANAMYDGIGRPFMFGCRTNGAMTWTGVRTMHGLGKEEFAPADSSLAKTPAGKYLFMWQPDNESFPPCAAFEPQRRGYDAADLAADYAGIIESSLGITYLYSRGFQQESTDPMYVTGGVTKIAEIVRRIAGIWNRPVATMGTVGAALGAAVAGASALAKGEGTTADVESLSASVLPRSRPVEPRADDVRAYHGDNGYLARLHAEYEKLR